INMGNFCNGSKAADMHYATRTLTIDNTASSQSLWNDSPPYSQQKLLAQHGLSLDSTPSILTGEDGDPSHLSYTTKRESQQDDFQRIVTRTAHSLIDVGLDLADTSHGNNVDSIDPTERTRNEDAQRKRYFEHLANKMDPDGKQINQSI